MNPKLRAHADALIAEANAHGWIADVIEPEPHEVMPEGVESMVMVGAERAPFVAVTAFGINERTGRVVVLRADGKEAVHVEHRDGRWWWHRNANQWANVMSDPYTWCHVDNERINK